MMVLEFKKKIVCQKRYTTFYNLNKEVHSSKVIRGSKKRDQLCDVMRYLGPELTVPGSKRKMDTLTSHKLVSSTRKTHSLFL